MEIHKDKYTYLINNVIFAFSMPLDNLFFLLRVIFLLCLVCQDNGRHSWHVTYIIVYYYLPMSGQIVVTEADLEKRLKECPILTPGYILVEDVTGEGQCGAKFVITVVSPAFAAMSILERHRAVRQTLENEAKHIHALTIKAMTPEQYKKKLETSNA